MTAQLPQNFAAFQTICSELILPAGTDIRGESDSPVNTFDYVRIDRYPGVTNLYAVYDWYDVAAGFTNEYRVALIHRVVGWEPPTP